MSDLVQSIEVNPFSRNSTTGSGTITSGQCITLNLNNGPSSLQSNWSITTSPSSGTLTLSTPGPSGSTVATYTSLSTTTGTITFGITNTAFGNTNVLTYTATVNAPALTAPSDAPSLNVSPFRPAPGGTVVLTRGTVARATSYEYRFRLGSVDSSWMSFPNTTLSFVIPTTATDGTTYRFQVRGVNSAGNGPNSTFRNAIVTVANTAPFWGTVTLTGGNQPVVGQNFTLSGVVDDADGDTLLVRCYFNTTNSNNVTGATLANTIPVGVPTSAQPANITLGDQSENAGTTRYYFLTAQDTSGTGTVVSSNTVAITPIAQGTGGGTTPGGGAADYGIIVTDGRTLGGQQNVLSPATRYMNRLTDNVTLSAVATHTFTLGISGLSASNCTVVGVGAVNAYTVDFPGNDVRITQTQGSLGGTYFVVRY